jgi:transcription-repair coupling factor (superfamily II helicase)
LPFERVSPEVETMGRRLALLWSLTHGEDDPSLPAPRVIVAPIRALLQRLGPSAHDAGPTTVRPGQELSVDQLLARLIAVGYRREHQVEHRGEVAVRGGIVDVFPSTADTPVRIDLWGDEVDRLTAFAVNDQRSLADLDLAVFFGCRELIPTTDVRSTAAALVVAQPWGATQWERLAEGESFDGMESWLPYVYPRQDLLPDLLPPGSQVVLVEPRRIRDRAVQILDEEAALAETLAMTWGATEESKVGFPRLHLPFDRLLHSSKAGVLALPSTPDGPATPAMTLAVLPAAAATVHLLSL